MEGVPGSIQQCGAPGGSNRQGALVRPERRPSQNGALAPAHHILRNKLCTVDAVAPTPPDQPKLAPPSPPPPPGPVPGQGGGSRNSAGLFSTCVVSAAMTSASTSGPTPTSTCVVGVRARISLARVRVSQRHRRAIRKHLWPHAHVHLRGGGQQGRCTVLHWIPGDWELTPAAKQQQLWRGAGQGGQRAQQQQAHVGFWW